MLASDGSGRAYREVIVSDTKNTYRTFSDANGVYTFYNPIGTITWAAAAFCRYDRPMPQPRAGVGAALVVLEKSFSIAVLSVRMW